MTGSERKLTKKIRLIVSTSMAVFFCLLLYLTVQLVIIGNQNRMLATLKNERDMLAETYDRESGMIDYYDSKKFIDYYALKELGYARNGAEIFG